MKDCVFFCSNNPKKYKKDTWRAILSQWYTCEPFYGSVNAVYDTSKVIGEYSYLYDSKPFANREQWMMCMKALLFAKDEFKNSNLQMFNQIVNSSNPKIIKSMGRKIKGFDEQLWKIWRYKFVVNGNYLQFSQNSKMKQILLGTKNRPIAEASSYDKIWGIGLNEVDALKTDEKDYGMNLLGKALMEVRELLKDHIVV